MAAVTTLPQRSLIMLLMGLIVACLQPAAAMSRGSLLGHASGVLGGATLQQTKWQGPRQDCARLMAGGPEQEESRVRSISWANLAALQPSYVAHQLTAQPTPQAGLNQMEADLQADHDVASRITKLAAYIAAKHHISNADALAICAAVGLEQLSQVNILSYGQGLRVGHLDVPAAAQAPSTQGCPVEQFKTLMHKLNLLDDKGNLKPEAYLAALEAAGTFPEGQAPVYASFQAEHQQVSRRRLTQVFWTSWIRKASPPPPPPPVNVFASSWMAWSRLRPTPSASPVPTPSSGKPIASPPPAVFIPKPVYAPPPAMALKAPPPPWYSYFFKRPPPPAFVAKAPPPPVFVAKAPPPPPVFVAKAPPPPPVFVAKAPPPPPVGTPTPNRPGVVPPSPYSTPASVCVTPTSGSINVRGFPSSTFPLSPFIRTFKDPVKAQKSVTGVCDRFGNCMDGYEINVREVNVNLDVGCPAGLPTTLITYDGLVPGPLFEVPVGLQTLVRFNNLIPADSVRYPEFEPCDPAHGRRGRPISVHLHGSASLAPYDGFATDEICSGETKDYIYPNNRPATMWYHDHALDITGDNAHGGLAGMYLVKEVNERWGLQGMEEHVVQLADRVMDATCQFVFDKEGAHQDDHFGDINLVNGVPFPVLNVDPKWVRFRILNSAVTRPWLLSFRTEQGQPLPPNINNNMCQVIASDGGFRRDPVRFPTTGLYMAPAERYEIVCDFSQVAGQTLILWNHQDTDRMKDVPFFCYSHLLMKVVVASLNNCQTCANAPRFQPTPGLDNQVEHEFVNNRTELAIAQAFARSGGCTRTFKFERGNGQWLINGESWHTARVAASDVGSNAWEVWCLETGGGWFHPIHIHLIDFYVAFRATSGRFQTLETYESEVPKDTVMLHPGAKVSGLARWGPHRGEYMFHCHNLRHEDNAMMRTLSTNNTITNTVNQSPQTFQLSRLTFSGGTSVLYDSYNNPLLPPALARPISAQVPSLLTAVQNQLNLEVYRIFYPGASQRQELCDASVNVWLVRPCPDFPGTGANAGK